MKFADVFSTTLKVILSLVLVSVLLVVAAAVLNGVAGGVASIINKDSAIKSSLEQNERYHANCLQRAADPNSPTTNYDCRNGGSDLVRYLPEPKPVRRVLRNAPLAAKSSEPAACKAAAAEGGYTVDALRALSCKI